MSHATLRDRVLSAVDGLRDEVVALTSALVRVPTVNPPGEAYDDCARLLGDALSGCGCDVEVRDPMRVDPMRTPGPSPLVETLRRGIGDVLGRQAAIVASPGTYDHKHVTRIGGVTQCVAYGPGILDLAHRPDEWCGVDDLVDATRVLALAIVDLVGAR